MREREREARECTEAAIGKIGERHYGRVGGELCVCVLLFFFGWVVEMASVRDLTEKFREAVRSAAVANGYDEVMREELLWHAGKVPEEIVGKNSCACLCSSGA